MEHIKQVKNYKVNKKYLKYFLEKYWFIPSDILQRGMEANIWELCAFKNPVLDIGIGNGELSTLLFKKHPQIAVGIDIEERGLEEARATNIYKKVLCANAEKMPFKDASFNTVISNSTFEHITNDLRAVAEVGRVLKKNGLFFITVPSPYLRDWILEYETQKDNSKAVQKLDAFNKRTIHLHYRSINEWEKHFKKHGMELLFYKYYFPKKTAVYWYKIFKIFTSKIKSKELWSYIGHSKLTKFIPQKTYQSILEKRFLREAYENGFFTDTEVGGQLFMIAKKS